MMGRRGRKQHKKQRKIRRKASAAPPRTVLRYPRDSTIEALLLAMIAKRAADETTGRVQHVWGFDCVDEATAERQTYTQFTCTQLTDGSVLDYTFGLQKRLPGIWGYGFAYLSSMGSLIPGAPMPSDTRKTLAESRIDKFWTPELMFGAVIYDARAGMHTTSMPLLTPEIMPTFDHTDTSPKTDEFVQAFHAGAVDADIWLSALALDIGRNEQVIVRAMPDITTLLQEVQH